MTDRDRQWQFYLDHPDTEPSALPARLDGLVDPPSKMAPTASLRRFRAMCAQCVEARPDHPNWPVFLAQIEAALAWRETIAPEDRFWRPDP